jgi:hypothetical protein
MMLIGLAGSAGTGKDTIADYLVEQHGFTKFSFSDALYREVSSAFDVAIDDLKDRFNKERAHPKLKAKHCQDKAFRCIMEDYARHRVAERMPNVVNANWYIDNMEFSPRWVLQHWGTEYRRQDDPEYWLKAASLWVKAWLEVTKDDGQFHAGLVNTSVRFPNEQEWIDSLNGSVWHVRRSNVSGVASELQHIAEQGLPVRPQDRILYNDGSIEQLNTAVSLLLASGGEPDRCAPPDVDPSNLVNCDSCGMVCLAYTEEQALAEIESFNNYFDAASDEEKALLGGSHATLGDYRECGKCGGSSFHKFVVGESEVPAPDEIYPVLFEGDK